MASLVALVRLRYDSALLVILANDLQYALPFPSHYPKLPPM